MRFATAPAETTNNTSIVVDAGSSLSFVGTPLLVPSTTVQVNGSIVDASGAGVASINSQDAFSWTPATRGGGTATFNKEGGGTLTVARLTNLQISTQSTSPATSSSGPFRDQFLDRVPFATINVNNGTLVIAAGRDISVAHAVQPTRPPTTVTGLTTGPFLVNQPTNKTTFAADEPVRLDLLVKNVPTLIVKVFEINAPNYYRTHGREVDHETLMAVLGPKLHEPVKIPVRVIQ